MSEPKVAKFQVVLPADLRTQFKAKCVIEGVTMNEMITQLIRDWTTGNGAEEKEEANSKKSASAQR